MTPSPIFDLSDRVAIVTGAGSGIGRATAYRLAEAGAFVFAADLDGTAAQETILAIERAGFSGAAERLDVRQQSEVVALVAAVLASRGRLDIMVNNAGITINRSVLETSEEDLDKILAVNLKGVLYGCQAAAEAMIDRGSGSIINMASAALDRPSPGYAAYSASKGAIAQLSRTFAVEIADTGVRVNTIAPGFIDTPINDRLSIGPDGLVDPVVRQEVLKMKTSPLGIVGEPDDVAYAVVYLASPAARYMTGSVLRVNGGASTPW